LLTNTIYFASFVALMTMNSSF